MASLTLLVFFLLVSTTIAIDETQTTQVFEKEERPAFQALPLQLAAEKKEFYFHVYFNEIFSGKGKNSETIISPNSDFPNFGDIGIMDVPLWADLNQNKLIARAQGAAFQANQNTYGWLVNYNIVFELEA
jgi:Dirigent-like protein